MMGACGADDDAECVLLSYSGLWSENYVFRWPPTVEHGMEDGTSMFHISFLKMSLVCHVPVAIP